MINSIAPHAPSLRAVQRQLSAYILAARPDLGSERLTPWLALPPGARAEERLAVYVGGYPARLHDALAEQFPALAHLVGARRFGELVARYGAGARLTSYSLNDAGLELPEFLRHDELGRAMPFVADLARLEWAVVRAFHAEQMATAAPGALAEWSADDWAAATLRFQPAVALIGSPWPLRALWEARDTPIAEVDIDLQAADQVIVHRRGFAVVARSIDPPQAHALARLLAGETLGVVAEGLDADGVGAADLVAWFGDWLGAGMVVEAHRTPA